MMAVLVDTSVWSLALRRRTASLNRREQILVEELSELIRDHRAKLIGPIRQELLSGIREEVQYERLRAHLRSFRDEPLATPDYELAAQLGNRCRAEGIATSTVDILICAVALDRGWSIFATDPDFGAYARVFEVGLYKPSNGLLRTS